MHRKSLSVFALFALTLVTRQSNAAIVLFQEDFETRATAAAISSFSPTVGDSFSGSNGIVSIDSSPTGTNVGGPASGAGGSVKFVEGGDPDFWRITPAAQALTTGDVVVLSFDFWMEDGGNKYVDLAATSSGGSLSFNIPIFSNGTIQWFHSGYHSVSGTFARGQWNNYYVAADRATGNFSATIGGISFTGTFPAGTQFDKIVLDLADTSNYFFYDNLLISVPEPASMALLVAGGVIVLSKRKRRRQAN